MSNDVNITVELWKYKRMMETLESFKQGIRVLKLNDLYKKSLLEDIHRIEGILKSGERSNVKRVAISI